MEREYQEMAQKVREMPEEDLTIYHEEDLTEQEKEDLPEGALMREKGNGPLYMKVLDIWEPYRVLTLHIYNNILLFSKIYKKNFL